MDCKKILIIHESEEVRRGIHNILSHCHFQFLYASNGLDGLAAAKYDRPDLVITDVSLKILDGLSLVRMLKKETKKKFPSIIFLNDKMDYNFLREARELGALGFLLPPYVDNSLIYTIQRALQQPVLPIGESVPFEHSLNARVPVISLAG